MSNRFIFSSESVGEGHPDKVADTISDAVLDACLSQDKFSRVACETFVKSNIVVVGGEITTAARFDYNQVIREAIRGIGYTNNDDVFHADQVFINNYLTAQSPDISQGVDAKKAKGKKTAEQGAGDQGLMFGYACNETPELMPTPIMFAHRLGRELTRIRKAGQLAPWLRPDAQSQVSVIYENDRPVGLSNVVISTQHTAGLVVTAAGPFQVRIRRRWIDQPLTWGGTSPKILSPPDWLTALKFNSPTPLVTQNRSASTSILSALPKMDSPTRPSPMPSKKCSASSQRTLSATSSCCVLYTPRPPTMVTLVRTIKTLLGKRWTR